MPGTRLTSTVPWEQIHKHHTHLWWTDINVMGTNTYTPHQPMVMTQTHCTHLCHEDKYIHTTPHPPVVMTQTHCTHLMPWRQIHTHYTTPTCGDDTDTLYSLPVKVLMCRVHGRARLPFDSTFSTNKRGFSLSPAMSERSSFPLSASSFCENLRLISSSPMSVIRCLIIETSSATVHWREQTTVTRNTPCNYGCRV